MGLTTQLNLSILTVLTKDFVETKLRHCLFFFLITGNINLTPESFRNFGMWMKIIKGNRKGLTRK